MKKYFIVAVLLLSNSIFAQAEVVSTFIEKWDNSKDYLVAVAQAMPEDQYDYKPSTREMSFKEQLFHIQDNMNWLSTTYFSNEKYVKKEAVKGLSKAQIIQEIKTSFDTAKRVIQKTNDVELSQKVEFFAGSKSKLQILNLMQDHVTHHRAQILVYLNLNQIQPPKYIGW
ncbi:DinB family protein [Flavobacterium sp. LB2P44]|uniref:DinB family protein n=1 Tax=Flavobacterium sp. LB2P44 TaxID=3401713 RepID=UPI003AAA4F3B